MERLTAKSEYDGTYVVPLVPLACEDGTLPDKDAVYQMVVDRLAMYEDRNEEGEWMYKFEENSENLFFRRRWYCSKCGDWNTYGETKYCMNCGSPMKVNRKTYSFEESDADT